MAESERPWFRSALEPDDLPGQAAVVVPGPEPLLPQDCEHGLGRVDEGAKVVAPQAAHDVVPADNRSVQEVAGRIGEDEQLERVAAGRAEQSLVVAVAADNAVEYDHVSGLDRVR